jgi:hypothetical protein
MASHLVSMSQSKPVIHRGKGACRDPTSERAEQAEKGGAANAETFRRSASSRKGLTLILNNVRNAQFSGISRTSKPQF